MKKPEHFNSANAEAIAMVIGGERIICLDEQDHGTLDDIRDPQEILALASWLVQAAAWMVEARR